MNEEKNHSLADATRAAALQRQKNVKPLGAVSLGEPKVQFRLPTERDIPTYLNPKGFTDESGKPLSIISAEQRLLARPCW